MVNDIKQALIVNRDDTNFVRIRVKNTGGATMDVKLLAGQSYIINTNQLSVSETDGAFASFETIDTVLAEADTAECKVEVIAFN